MGDTLPQTKRFGKFFRDESEQKVTRSFSVNKAIAE
jgi:hypothetical protein